MAIHFLVGQACSGKSTYLYKKILEEAKNNLKKNYIIVVPEQFGLATEKELINLSDGHGVLNVEVLSFTRLSYRIMAEAGDEGYPLLNDMGKTMLIRRIMQEKKDELKIYRGKERNIGFIDEIKSAISEMGQYLITPDKLNGYIDSAKEILLLHKMSDFNLIYEEYSKRISGNYCTAENVSEMCFKHFESSLLLKNSVFVFDGFTGFTPVQLKFIEHLLGKMSEGYVCLSGDETTVECNENGQVFINDNPGIFSMSTSTIDSIEKLAVKNGHLCDVINYDVYNYLEEDINKLRNNVFKTQFDKVLNSENIKLYASKDKKEEAACVAAEIRDLLCTYNYKYKDIAVISGDVEGYRPYFEKSFKDYGIEFYSDKNRDITDNPLIVFINRALRIIESGYSRENVISFLKSPLLDLDENDICEFENYLLCYDYRGKSLYSKKWEYYKKLKKSVDMNTINQIREELVSHISILPDNLNDMNIREFTHSIVEFLQSYGIKEKLGKLAKQVENYDIDESAALSREYKKVYDAVINILCQIDDILGDDNCSLKEFNDLFMTGIKKTKLGMIPQSPDVVIIGDLWRTRLKDIKVLFIVGMNEGVIPRVENNNGLFTESEKNILKEAGIETAVSAKENPEREEFYIYLAMSRPSEKIYFSYIGVGDSGDEVRPSYVVGNLQRVLDLDKIKSFNRGTLGQKIGFDNGVSYVLKSISDNVFNDTSLAGVLFDWYSEHSMAEKERIIRIKDEFDKDMVNLSISEAIAKKLYGNIINSSVSRIEKFASCAFMHFIKYGLGIDKREEYREENIDLGLICHEVLKDFGTEITNSDTDWYTLEPDVFIPLANKCLDNTLKNYSDGMYLDNNQMKSLSKRMTNVVNTTVTAMVEQIQAGSYIPYKYEAEFKTSGSDMNLNGIIDRIDVCEIEGKKHVKVVDYKTGDKQIEYPKLYNGIQIQLVLYMNYLINNSELKGSIPSVMLYQHVDNPAIETKDIDIDNNNSKISKLKPNGIVGNSFKNIIAIDKQFSNAEGNGYTGSYDSGVIHIKTNTEGELKGEYADQHMADSEEINKLLEFADKKSRKISHDIMKGDVSINPYKLGDDDTACKFCNYKTICGFDKKISDYKYRNIDDTKENIIAKIIKETEKKNSNDKVSSETSESDRKEQ